MMPKKEIFILIGGAIIFIIASQLSRQYSDALSDVVFLQGFLGKSTYVLSAFTATVIAPLTVLPLFPALVSVWGPFQTALLSMVGWVAGGVVAFLLARRFGHPLVHRLIAIEKLEHIEKFIPEKNIFWSVVFLRIALPVDVLSYALGLFSKVSVRTYVLATVLGAVPFAFVFAYLSTFSSIFQISAFALGIVILFFGYRHVSARYHRYMNSHHSHSFEHY